jgi:hypothetical protein
MRTPLTVCLAGWVGLAIVTSTPHIISAQAPTSSSEPRLAVPRTAPVAQPTAQPTAAPAPDAPAPTAAASPDTTHSGASAGEVTQVTGASSGLTQLGGGAGGQQTSSTSYAATDARSYTAGRFSLLIEGKPVLFVKKLQGGTLVGSVGQEGGAKKHLTGTKVEEISVEFGIAGKPILDWVAQSWKGDYQRKNGSIVTGDFNYKSAGQVDFSGALITETTVPKLDGSSKDAAYFTVKIQPQTVRFSRGDGTSIKDASIGAKQKQWLTSNFRFEMDGVEGTKVASIESFTVRQAAAGDVGEVREATKASGGIEFPNLQLSISQASMDSWDKWYNDFVVNGNNDDQHEKNGAIVFLGPDMKVELGRINLSNCGIFRLADDKEANSGKIKRFTAELYCERMELVPPSTAS